MHPCQYNTDHFTVILPEFTDQDPDHKICQDLCTTHTIIPTCLFPPITWDQDKLLTCQVFSHLKSCPLSFNLFSISLSHWVCSLICMIIFHTINKSTEAFNYHRYIYFLQLTFLIKYSTKMIGIIHIQKLYTHINSIIYLFTFE